VGLAVFSHYPLDVLVHIPDLQLSGGSSVRLGLGLWNNPVATLIAEAVVFGIGLAIYVARRSNRHPVRLRRLVIVVLLLVATYVASLLGPVPSSMTVVAVSDIVFLLGIAALAAWADRRASHRELDARGLSHR
jgi:uncharacterized membrane protein HdeD (DUF308 family)